MYEESKNFDERNKRFTCFKRFTNDYKQLLKRKVKIWLKSMQVSCKRNPKTFNLRILFENDLMN